MPNSQTDDCVAAIPRRERRLHFQHLLEQCDSDHPDAWSRFGRAGNTAPDEAGATRSAAAEPGGKEGRHAIRTVRGREAFARKE